MSYVGINFCAIYYVKGSNSGSVMIKIIKNSVDCHSYSCLIAVLYFSVPSPCAPRGIIPPLPTPSTLPLCCSSLQWHSQILNLGWARWTFPYFPSFFYHFLAFFLNFFLYFFPSIWSFSLPTLEGHGYVTVPPLYSIGEQNSLLAVPNAMYAVHSQVRMQYLQC